MCLELVSIAPVSCSHCNCIRAHLRFDNINTIVQVTSVAVFAI
jgi:hypothetical protein